MPPAAEHVPADLRASRPATLVAHNGAAIFGGAERWTVRLLAGLQGRGHRVLFLCRDEDIAARARARGVPARVAHLGGHVALHDAARLALQLRRLAPDGLLLGTFKKTWLGAMAAHGAGVPRVVARIGLSSDRPGRRWVYRVAFRRWIHRIVVNADGLRAGVLEDLPGIAPERVITLYNGVDGLESEPGPGSGTVRRALGISPETPVVGTVARLAEQKRLGRLLDAVARLPSEVHCVIAGDGPERSGLEARAARPDLADRVHILGHRDDVAAVLGALDLLVVTSDREGMSNSMLEALAAGVPVVSTDVSGADEALGPGPDGVPPGVVVPREAEAVAAAVSGLLDDADLRRRMGEAGRRRVRERFDQRQKILAWETLLARDVEADVHEGPSALQRRGAAHP